MTTWREIIETGDINAVRERISSGADVNEKDKESKTALDYARRNGRDDIVALLEMKEK